jgi:hypothetical protein
MVSPSKRIKDVCGTASGKEYPKSGGMQGKTDKCVSGKIILNKAQ